LLMQQQTVTRLAVFLYTCTAKKYVDRMISHQNSQH
jgi:hypothetical protein